MMGNALEKSRNDLTILGEFQDICPLNLSLSNWWICAYSIWASVRRSWWRAMQVTHPWERFVYCSDFLLELSVLNIGAYVGSYLFTWEWWNKSKILLKKPSLPLILCCSRYFRTRNTIFSPSMNVNVWMWKVEVEWEITLLVSVNRFRCAKSVISLWKELT